MSRRYWGSIQSGPSACITGSRVRGPAPPASAAAARGPCRAAAARRVRPRLGRRSGDRPLGYRRTRGACPPAYIERRAAADPPVHGPERRIRMSSAPRQPLGAADDGTTSRAHRAGARRPRRSAPASSSRASRREPRRRPEVGVGPGPARGRRARTGTPTCSATATGATSPTTTATGGWMPSSPTSTPVATRSTSPSRTGATTSTSARSCAPRTRSTPPPSTSSGKRRWNRRGAMVTDRYQHEHHHPSVADLVAWAASAGTRAAPASRSSGSTTCPARWPLETHDLPRECVLVLGQEGPGLTPEMLGGLHGRAAHRAVRVDPVDQRGRRRRHRHARVGAQARLRAGSPVDLSNPGAPRASPW